MDRGRTAELAEHHDQGRVQHAAGREVVEKRRDRLIQWRQEVVAQAGKVGQRCVWIDRHRQQRGIRRDHPIQTQTALETQTGDAKGLVLIIHWTLAITVVGP